MKEDIDPPPPSEEPRADMVLAENILLDVRNVLLITSLRAGRTTANFSGKCCHFSSWFSPRITFELSQSVGRTAFKVPRNAYRCPHIRR